MKILFDKDTFTISSKLKSTPKFDWVLFDKIKNRVLGEDYELSLSFMGKGRMRDLNRIHRGKDYTTDVLSFPLDDFSPEKKGTESKNAGNSGSKMGEIFINLDVANKKAKDFDRTPTNYLSFLFIHSLFHLKGLDHGDEMEMLESAVREFFGI
ncbi:MAG: rRNA maturation RNase YbeY [bacterium]